MLTTTITSRTNAKVRNMTKFQDPNSFPIEWDSETRLFVCGIFAGHNYFLHCPPKFLSEAGHISSVKEKREMCQGQGIHFLHLIRIDRLS